jgi:membrane-bound lytic murein transglycosylase D
MVPIASLLMSGLVCASMSWASPVANPQNQTTVPTRSVKDSLIAGNTLAPINPNPYGFTSLLPEKESSPTDIPLTAASSAHSLTFNAEAHSAANGLVKEYLKSDKEKLTSMKSWGIPYFNRIDKILTDHNVPVQLRYLAVIESELKHSATSKVGAKGFWQFMPNTARLYGLTVNQHMDERTDLDKSTRAAARYLQDLYDELHDWLLVIAAYDGGTAVIHSAIRKAGSRDFFDLQYYLPLECRNHVKRFIATNFFMEVVPAGPDLLPGGPKELTDILTAEDLANTAVQAISGHFTASGIAEHLSMTLPDFVRLNPNFDNQVSGSAECYNLRVPKDKMELFNSDKDAILSESVRGLLNEEEEDQQQNGSVRQP